MISTSSLTDHVRFRQDCPLEIRSNLIPHDIPELWLNTHFPSGIKPDPLDLNNLDSRFICEYFLYLNRTDEIQRKYQNKLQFCLNCAYRANSASFHVVYVVCRYQEVVLAQRNVRQLLVYRLPLIVERGCLEDNSTSATDTGQSEDPQEESVQYHRHVFPVFHYLKT